MGTGNGKTRVLLWGLGAMGSGMASMLLENPDVEIVAAVELNPAKVGKDLGEVLDKPSTGVIVTHDADEAFESRPDIALISISSFVSEVYPAIETALQHDANVITIAEEMAYPWAASQELADKIDSLAKQKGKAVLGTGINPGFILDTLIIALTGICMDVEHIHGKRVNDLSPLGPTVM